MLSENLRKRIAALNRKEPANRPTPEAAGEDPPDPQVVGPRRATSKEARLAVPLEAVATGSEVEGDAGVFLRIDRELPKLLPSAGKGFQRRFVRAVEMAGSARSPVDLGATLEPLSLSEPTDLLFVDIEATGLTSGTPLFLIGVLALFDGKLVVTQLLARDYAEEAPLLAHFADMLARSRVVVSFNGKTYDLPYIRDRSAFCGVPFDAPECHIDLLHESRRRWRDQLPNCRLQTLERYLCRRMRSGDIPGDQIGGAYHRFVQSGNAVDMRDILQHNALDLITLAEVMVCILEGRDP